jgi:hypothetical protein
VVAFTPPHITGVVGKLQVPAHRLGGLFFMAVSGVIFLL